MINQGDIFWIDLSEPLGSELGYCRPHVVIQNNQFNHSQINTVIVCTLTSNLRRAKAPGNVLLESEEADLPEQSVFSLGLVDRSALLFLNQMVIKLSIRLRYTALTTRQ